jgi:hypothetical protein
MLTAKPSCTKSVANSLKYIVRHHGLYFEEDKNVFISSILVVVRVLSTLLFDPRNIGFEQRDHRSGTGYPLLATVYRITALL